MPRYFFRFADDDQPSDMDSVELPDLKAARLAATEIVAERLKGNGMEFWELGRWRLVVSDSSGTPLFTLSLSSEKAAAG